MIVAWTGHRPELLRDPAAALAAVDSLARRVVAVNGDARFVVGGQRGVDTWAALAALALDVPYVLILPLDADEFARGWSLADRAVLDSTLDGARSVQIVGGDPAAAYAERNRRLATQADLLVAVWTRTLGGGTAETIQLARAAGTRVCEIVLEPAADAGSAHGRGI